MKSKVEFIDEKKEAKKKSRKTLREVLDGSLLGTDWFVNNIVFVIFLALLAVIYISNRYHAEKVMRESMQLQEQVEELRAEATSIASRLMGISKQSEVVKMIKEKELGLIEAVEPPGKIVISKNEE